MFEFFGMRWRGNNINDELHCAFLLRVDRLLSNAATSSWQQRKFWAEYVVLCVSNSRVFHNKLYDDGSRVAMACGGGGDKGKGGRKGAWSPSYGGEPSSPSHRSSVERFAVASGTRFKIAEMTRHLISQGERFGRGYAYRSARRERRA